MYGPYHATVQYNQSVVWDYGSFKYTYIFVCSKFVTIPLIIDHLQAPELRHFIYKSRKTSSMTSPRIPDMYADADDKERSVSD